jgi:hypothetical protein
MTILRLDIRPDEERAGPQGTAILSAIIQKRIFLNGRRIGQHHPRRRRNHLSDYPCVWRLLTTSLLPMAALA